MIFLLIIMCVSSYDKFLSIIDENTKYKIQLELDKMQEEYFAQLDEKLNELHSLRHDMKNHLIVIDGYAKQENYTKIHDYISVLTNNLSTTDQWIPVRRLYPHCSIRRNSKPADLEFPAILIPRYPMWLLMIFP